MAVYLLNFLLTIGIGKLIDKYKTERIGEVLIISIWAILIGFQFNVGSDYFGYLEMFSNIDKSNYPYFRGEYLFYYFIVLYQKIFENGQYAFVIISIIQSIIFFKIMNYVKIRKKCIFLILFLCICTIFHNQMNLIRQSFAIYLCTLSTVYFIFNKKVKSIATFICEFYIHKSSIFTLPIYLLCFFNIKINNKKIIYFGIITLVFLIIPFKNTIILLMRKTPYQYYIQYQDYFEELPVINILSKCIYFPLFYIAVKNKKKMMLNKKEEKLFDIGIIAYFLKLLFMKNVLLYRIGEYYTIILLFPIYYLLERGKLSLKNKIVIYSYIILPYIYKILTFYEYRSYFYKNL